jgi:hypothetical protein
MTAEYATVKSLLPVSKKPLQVKPDGTWDKALWTEAQKQTGQAAKAGDVVQITRIQFEDDNILIEINNGPKGGRKWYDNVQVSGGTGNNQRPVNRPRNTVAIGTHIQVRWEKDVPSLDVVALKQILGSVLQFDGRSVTESYVDTLPPETKKAIQEKRPLEGMDADQLILAMGKPGRKTRETKDGLEEEDWIYGRPPGKIVFVTMANGKVTRVREAWAGLGGSTAPDYKTP